MSTEATRVGIAIVEQAGCYLVGTRGPHQVLAGLAEFPGGKCQVGESPESAVVRECLEETGLTVTPVQLLEQGTHDYDHGRVELHFWLCEVSAGSGSLERHSGFDWLTAGSLASLSFPDANRSVVARLIQENAHT